MTDAGAPGRGGRPAKPSDLVRPYVLKASGYAHRRPTHRAAGQPLNRGDQPTLDWIGDLGSRHPSEACSESTRRDQQTTPRAVTAPLTAEKPAGNHRVVRRGRWLVAIGGIPALAIVAGAILLLSQPSSKLLAGACGEGGCRHGVTGTSFGVMPPAGAPTSTHKAVHRTDPTTTLPTTQPSAKPPGSHPVPGPTSSSPEPQPTRSSPAPTSPSPTPTTTAPTASPSPTPTSSPTPKSVHVSYTLVSQQPHSFQGKFTIVNNGTTAVHGWELAVVLPDDSVRSVWDGMFHTDGGTVYIDPSSSQQTIAPGATITENFVAHGSTTALASCTFNGSAC